MGDESNPSGDSVITSTGGLLCDECGTALPPPKRKTKFARRFCRPRCRASWHKKRKAEALASARSRINEALDDLEKL